MRGPDAREPLAVGFDPRSEVIPTLGSLLLKMGLGRFQVVVGQGFMQYMQQLAIGLGARLWCGGERVVCGMRHEDGVSAKPVMGGAARPRKGGGSSAVRARTRFNSKVRWRCDTSFWLSTRLVL